METGWQTRRLLDSPHRLGFVAAGAVMAVTAIGWLLLLPASRPALAAALPAPAAHGLASVFGFMPLFFAGFLFTVGPRWRGHAIDDASARRWTRRLRAPLVVYACAWLAWWPAWGASAGRGVAAWVCAGLLVLAAAAWSTIAAHLAALWRSPSPRPGPHPSPHLGAATLACAAGAVLLWAVAAAAALQATAALHALTQAALWIFCGGVFASASHRMLPLDAVVDRPALEARHPLWLLATLMLVLVLQGLHALVSAAAWPLPAAWHALQAAAAAAGAALFGHIAWRWARRRRLGRQLVAMLHLALVWLVAALALQAVAHALAASGRPGVLGPAPAHALALGWMGSTLFAMASRVAGAFGGRPQTADGVTWAMFGLVQAAALARVAAALGSPAAASLTTLAGAAWAAAALGWLILHGRWLGRVRAAPGAQRGT